MTYFLTLLILLDSIFFAPPLQSQEAACGIPTDQTAPTFEWNSDDGTQADYLAEQIVDYLNATHSTEHLETALFRDLQAESGLDVEVLEGDFSGDGRPDVLVQHQYDYGASYEYTLNLYHCEEGTYRLLNTLFESLQSATFAGEPNARIELAVDLNGNQRPDVLVRRRELGGQKIFTGLVMFEWNGSAWEETFSAYPRYEGFGDIRMMNLDDNPLTLEFTITSAFYYESGTAMAFIEYSKRRLTETLYIWDGEQYTRQCTYFSDDQTRLTLHVLHNAEVYRACGWYEEAQALYELLLREDPVPYYGHILYPEDISTEEEQRQYVADVELAYYRSFAAYRLLQLALNSAEDLETARLYAEDYLDYDLEDLEPGDHGYVYRAMGIALWEAYQQTEDLQAACEAATAAFESADDPGLIYDEPFTFYYGWNGHFYGANPDNLFEVPEDIAGMISTPVCLE